MDKKYYSLFETIEITTSIELPDYLLSINVLSKKEFVTEEDVGYT